MLFRTVLEAVGLDPASRPAHPAAVGADPGSTVHELIESGSAHAYRRRPGDVARAGDLFRQAASLARQLDSPEDEAQALLALAIFVHHAEGDDQASITALSRARSLAPEGSQLALSIFSAHALIHLEAGRGDDAALALRLAREQPASGDRADLILQLVDARLADTEEAVAILRRWGRDSPATGDGDGAIFHARASGLAQDTGLAELALAHLRHAEHLDADHGAVALARATYEARYGDPAVGLRMLRVPPSFPDRLARHQWLILAAQSVAADRMGDAELAAQLAVEALSQGNALGLAHLLEKRGWQHATRVRELARGQAREQGTAIRLFGRFSVRVDGVPRTPAGQAATLVKMIAVAPGAVSARDLITALWPDADPQTGRRRLRNLLNRLRTEAGPLVVREEDRLTISGGEIDVAVLRRALAEFTRSGASQQLRQVWPTAPLLMDDLFDDWAAGPREELSLELAETADRLAAAAAARGLPGEEAWWLERAVEQLPFDLERHDTLVAAVAALGDPVRLAAVTRRAIQAYRALDLTPPTHYPVSNWIGSRRDTPRKTH